MPWVLVDVLIAAVAVLLLLAALVSCFLHVKGLIRAGRSASARVSEAMPPSPAPRR